MNVEENQRVIDAFVDAFNRRDWNNVENLYAESVVYWTPDNLELKKGRAAVRDLLVGYVSAFPDARNRKERPSAREIGLARSTSSRVPIWDL